MRNLFTLLLLSLLLFAGQIGFCQNSKVPSKDQFSGKTVTSQEMGLELLRTRNNNAPRAGEKAPAFELKDQETGELVALSSLHKDKPLVLLFTSYQCDVFQRGWPSFRAVYEKYQSDCNFALIYIREAHSPASDITRNSPYLDPVTDMMRMDMAGICRREMKVPFQILVDGIKDPVGTRWAGWPIRMFVIKTDGTVGYASINGPWGFNPGDDFVHGDGTSPKRDPTYSQTSLAAYLRRFLKKK